MSNSETGYYYRIQTRGDWQQGLLDRFGKSQTKTHLLTDSEVIELIMKFGRASIEEEANNRLLYFQDDYD